MEKSNTPDLAAIEGADQAPWKPWKKFSFRFFFLYFLVLSTIAWDLLLFLMWMAFSENAPDIATIYKPLSGFFYWLDKHLYHTGYNPKIHGSYPQDNHFAVIFYATMAILSVIGAIVWGIMAKNKPNHNKLFYWFNLYLRYLLAIIIFSYGMIKLIPIQMGHPDAVSMLAPYGSFNRFTVLWSFMGMSPGYMMFTGSLEAIAGLLLVFRRTAVAGALLTFAILVNVVALNWFYNVPVKLFSAQLAVFALFLLAPFLKNIFQFFFKNNAAPLTQKRYTFQTRWKRNLLTVVLTLILLAGLLLPVIADCKKYRHDQIALRKEKIYDVVSFVAKDTLPPLTTDTLRWKRLFLHIDGTYFVVWDMKDEQHWYEFDDDSVKKIFTVHVSHKKTTWQTFHYTYPTKNQLQLTGTWKGKDISALMKLSPVDSIDLNKEKIRLIQE